MDIIEKEYKLSSDIEKYPTKMVIKHDLEPAYIYIGKGVIGPNIRSFNGKGALSVTLTIAGNEYSKKDVKEKITEIFHTLIEEYC